MKKALMIAVLLLFITPLHADIWQIEPIADGWCSSLVLDSSGNPHVSIERFLIWLPM